MFSENPHKRTLKQNDASMAREESPVCHIICSGKYMRQQKNVHLDDIHTRF